MLHSSWIISLINRGMFQMIPIKLSWMISRFMTTFYYRRIVGPILVSSGVDGIWFIIPFRLDGRYHPLFITQPVS
jgi:hypothetical protein